MNLNLRRRECVTLVTILILSYCKTAWTDCASEEWECDDGQCIDDDDRCNGRVDCADGTDEIAEYCIDKPCQEFAFHCTYGACIRGTERCNGNKGCADGSDEMPLLCNSTEEIKQLEAQQRGSCPDDSSMQCKSGECIEIENICDGRLDCSDGSDETVELCSTTYCPSFAFKCGYGACIKGTSKCDHIIDCPDGSDEAAELCNRPRVKGKRNGTTTPTVTNAPPTVATTITPGNFCQIPSNQQNLIATDLTTNVIPSGMRVQLNTIVQFRCKSAYTLEGEQQNYCAGRGWQKNVPTCIKYCAKSHLHSKLSSRAVCYYNDNQVACNDRIRPQTQARLSCANGFTPPPVHQGIIKREVLNCKADGTWDYDPYRCNMLCGLVAPKTQQFSVGGNKINITEVPWHVGIYSMQNSVTFIHTCGGTIITPNLIISAAHCFWDPANQQTFKASLYNVVAGKYFRDYDSDQEIFQVQKRNVSEIHVPSTFVGGDDNYRDDIAVIKLTAHLKFGESIRPVCVEFFERSQKEIPNYLVGNFAGWGITDKQRPSDVLQSVSMQTLSYQECARRLDDIHPNYKLPDDKFCLFDEYGSTACKGDSGGGFVISYKDANGKDYYSLIGIVSHSAARGDCAQDGLVVMTNVRWFRSFIQPIKSLSEDEF